MDPKHPIIGEQHIDATDINLVDITADVISTFVKLRDGADKAMANVERLKPEEIERAGISEKAVQTIVQLVQDYRYAEELLPVAEKLAERLHETKLERGHRIAQMIGEICAQARRRAERDPKGSEILGPFEDMMNYQFAPAKKAVATKEKSKAEGAPSAPVPPGQPA